MQLESRLTLATLVSLGLVACSAQDNAPNAGADASLELDAGPGVDAGTLGICPPRGTFGVQEGDVLPSPALVDCEGRPFDLHTLCGKTAAYQFHFAGW